MKFEYLIGIIILFLIFLLLWISGSFQQHEQSIFLKNETGSLQIIDLHEDFDIKPGEHMVSFKISNNGSVIQSNISILVRMDDKYPKSLLDIERRTIPHIEPGGNVTFKIPLHYRGEYDQLHFRTVII